ncbi:MAG: regulatory protein RecX [Gammaproteobacteria bacterium]|nr:regulatory protein RecX [Gammaproteobacteria bacterium]
MQRKLDARGYEAQAVRTVLDQLEAEQLQSDERFIEAFVHHRTDKGYGPCRIAQELRQRGISDNLLATYIDLNELAWHERAAVVRQKRFGSELPSDYRERARQSRFLQYRGFTSEQIRHVMNPACH